MIVYLPCKLTVISNVYGNEVTDFIAHHYIMRHLLCVR